MVDGRQTVTGRLFAFPLTVGRTWKAAHVEPRTIGRQTFAHFATTYRVVGWERVSTPAGEFRVLKIEGNGTIEARFAPAASAVSGTFATSGGATTFSHVEGAGGTVLHATSYSEFYYVPAIKYYVKTLQEQYNFENVRTSRDTEVLVASRPGR